MDFATLTAAAVLLAVLPAWYAFLQYVDRRRGQDVSRSRRGPVFFAALLATLPSDFFFLEPAFAFTPDWQVFRLSLVYALGGLLGFLISRRPARGLSA